MSNTALALLEQHFPSAVSNTAETTTPEKEEVVVDTVPATPTNHLDEAIPQALLEKEKVVADRTRKETAQERYDRIKTRFMIFEDFANETFKGTCRSLIVSGEAGLGKSFVVTSCAKKWDPGKSGLVTVAKGYARATALFKLAFKHKDFGTIVCDDLDSIWDQMDALNILKTICDTTDERWVTWGSEKEFVDPETLEIIPHTFQFKGSVIFLTNIDLAAKAQEDYKMSGHYKALVSRSHYIDLDMRTAADYVTRIQMCIEDGLLDHLPDDQREEVMDFITENYHDLREVSLRIALKIADARKMEGRFDWKEYAKVTCCKNRHGQ